MQDKLLNFRSENEHFIAEFLRIELIEKGNGEIFIFSRCVGLAPKLLIDGHPRPQIDDRRSKNLEDHRQIILTSEIQK
jgi:hypothetical protein